MPSLVTPGEGGLSAYIHAAHTMLVGSASWRAYMINGHADLTGDSDETAFLKYIFQGDTVDDGLDYDDTEMQTQGDSEEDEEETEVTDEIRLTQLMPLVVAYEEDDFSWTPLAQCSTTQFEISGTVSFVFMDKTLREAEDAPGLLDAKLRFANWIDGVVSDWNGTVLPTNIQNITLPGSIVRNRATARPIEDYWMAKLSITFGTTQGGG
jgi:hypothetical protein